MAVARIIFLLNAKETSAQMAEVRDPESRERVRFFEWGQAAPPHQLGGLGSATGSPSGVRAEPWPPNRFHASEV